MATVWKKELIIDEMAVWIVSVDYVVTNSRAVNGIIAHGFTFERAHNAKSSWHVRGSMHLGRSLVIGRNGRPGAGRREARQIKCRSSMCRNSGRTGSWARDESAAARGAHWRGRRFFARFIEV